ncbi:phospho-acceptor domain-containing protein [Mucilaginibacter frigoritolerans]|uniref:histidine kinase n=1 Tax=Mucilaginibacter frigoritolerans TaxID=652788 RepID=A0A562TU64_9SPHI|nr:HAMP domain-containing sensor histidine kinase [Mucilaginibacter frigoritolerans]TWI96788.1 phospho-acceptor domain-containing protein [Mucilaginibacter frigoritolerans]
MKRVIITLSVVVLIATIIIGVTNYYSVKILSATRAYSNFESQYSKGEKDASRHLMSYIYSKDDLDYLFFKDDINIPLSAGVARNALETGKDIEIVRICFLMAGNHSDDLQQLIWFFQHFKKVPLFKGAVMKWQQADVMVNKLNAIGVNAHKGISKGQPIDKEGLVLQINTISDNLNIIQQNFSTELGITARMVNYYVFVINITILIVILGCTAILMGIMLTRLYSSKKVIADQNQALVSMNGRINKLVYNVTHDLRAPLSSLTGLISVLEREKDIAKLPDYTEMMRASIEQQDKFIQDVLYAIKNGTEYRSEVCNLTEIVNDVISQNNFSAEGKQVTFVNELEVSELKCNIMGLKVIFNNLISNAIKYADFSKPEQWVKFKSYRTPKHCVIEIEDNGLGIKPEQKNRIFNKFFKSGFNKKSMGLGLYFTKQAIEEMNGTITVKSFPGSGTSFIVSLPL